MHAADVDKLNYTTRGHMLNNYRLFLSFGIIQIAFLLGCGQVGTNTSTNQPNSPGTRAALTITPGSATVITGQSVQFNAALNGANATSVVWSVNGSVGGNASVGTIDSSGVYTAPNAQSSETVAVTASLAGNMPSSSPALVGVVVPGQTFATQNSQVVQYSITIPKDATVSVQFGPDTAYGLQTWSQPTPAGGGQVNIFVAGMRASATYHMRAIAQCADGTQFVDSDHVFTTGSLPANLLPNVTVTASGAPTPGIEMLNLNDSATSQVQVVATDLQGNVIWYYNGFNPAGGISPQPIKLLPNGDVLLALGPVSSAPASSALNVLREIDLAGDTIRELSVSGLNARLAAAGFNLAVQWMHHDVLPLPNGHLILIVNTTQNFTNLPGYPGTTAVLGDALVDLDSNWQPVWEWSSFDHLDVNRHPMSFPDWTHSNAVIYSPDDGNLLLSVRHQYWVLKIDYENGMGSGNILWRLGPGGDFTLTGGTDPIDWFYAQHGPKILSTNSTGSFTLGLFDNGNNRQLDSSGTVCGSTGAPACYTRVPIFQVDENAKTAQVVWQDKPGNFSSWGGYMQEFSNGNIEFDESAPSLAPPIALVTEVTQQSTPQIVWQMQITGQNAYRAARIPSLYPGVQW